MGRARKGHLDRPFDRVGDLLVTGSGRGLKATTAGAFQGEAGLLPISPPVSAPDMRSARTRRRSRPTFMPAVRPKAAKRRSTTTISNRPYRPDRTTRSRRSIGRASSQANTMPSRPQPAIASRSTHAIRIACTSIPTTTARAGWASVRSSAAGPTVRSCSVRNEPGEPQPVRRNSTFCFGIATACTRYVRGSNQYVTRKPPTSIVSVPSPGFAESGAGGVSARSTTVPTML